MECILYPSLRNNASFRQAAQDSYTLQEHRTVLDRLAELLVEKERIGQEEFEALFEQNDETIEENL